jgi:hypothetical protein
MNIKKAWKKYLNQMNKNFFEVSEVKEMIQKHGNKGSVVVNIELNNHPCKIRLNLKTKRWESALIVCIETFIVTNTSFHWNLLPRKLQ